MPMMTLSQHLAETTRLAIPTALSRTGIMLLTLTTIVMIGRYDAQELAYFAIGSSPFAALLVTMIGLLLGTAVYTSLAYGAQRFQECGAVWRRTLPFALGLGAVGIGIGAFGESFLRLTGQGEDLAVEGGRVMLLACLGLPGQLVYTVSVLYLEGVKRPQPGLMVIVAANVLQIVLCLALVDGIVTWGAVGGVIAMGITRTAMAVAIVGFVVLDRRAQTFGVFSTLFPAWSSWRPQRRLGYANGLSNGLETMGFTVLMIMAGHVSALQLGGFSVALNLLATVFMAAVGIGGAGAVRIGSLRGAQQPASARRAGWVALGLNTVVMTIAGVAAVVLALPIASFYTTDPALITVVAGLMLVVALVMPVDGGQVVLASMLRGFNDGIGPTICHFISYIVVMLPAGWVLAIKLERGAQGLFEAVLIASIVSMAILAARYWSITRRL